MQETFNDIGQDPKPKPKLPGMDNRPSLPGLVKKKESLGSYANLPSISSGGKLPSSYQSGGKTFDDEFKESNKNYEYFNEKLVGKMVGRGDGSTYITPYKTLKENSLKPEALPQLNEFKEGDIIEYPKADYAPTGYKQLQGNKWVDINKPAQVSKIGQEVVVKALKPTLDENKVKEDLNKKLSDKSNNDLKYWLNNTSSKLLDEKLVKNPELLNTLSELVKKQPTKTRTVSGRFSLFEEAIVKNYKLDKDAFVQYPTVDHAEFQKNIKALNEAKEDQSLSEPLLKYFARKDVADLLHLLALQETGDQELSSALNYFPNFKKQTLKAEEKAHQKEGMLSGAGKSLAKGTLDLLANTLYGGMKMTPGMIAFEKATGMDKVTDELKDRYDLWARASLTSGEAPNRFSEILNQTLETAPQMAGLVLTRNPIAANALFVATPSFGQSYKENLEKGLSEPAAYVKGISDAAIQSLSESISPDRKLIAGFKPSKALTELGAKEFGSEAFNTAFKKEVRDFWKSKPKEFLKEFGGQYLEEQVADKATKLQNVVVNALAETDFNTEVNSEEELNLLGSVALLTGGTKALGLATSKSPRESLRQDVIERQETETTPTEVIKKLNSLEKAVEEGKITGIYADLVKQGKSEDVLKDIAQQAQNIGQDGTKLTDGKDAEIKKATIDQFGEDVVNEAIEKYPESKPDLPKPTVKKSVLEKPIEEVSIDDIFSELEGKDEGLAFKDVSNTDIKEGDAKNIEAYNQRAEKVLKALYPNAEFQALNTTQEYEQATGRKGEAGVLIRGKEGGHKLFLNLEAIKGSNIERTATHEVVHALVSDAIGAKYADLRKKWDELQPKLYKVKGFEVVKEHLQNYSSADRPVEGITDLLANIVHNKIKLEDIPKNLWDEFIEFVNRAFEAIGIDYKITPDTFNGFASSVKQAFETGDFKNLQKFTSKSKTDKFFKEHPEFAKAELAMVDPAKRKQLEDLLKTKIEQELNQGKINQEQANEFYRRAGIEPPKVEDGDGKGGITHAATQDTTRKAGLPDYEKPEPVTHEERIEKAKQEIAANPNIHNEIMEKVEKGGRLEVEDNAVLAVYKNSLDAELEANPSKELYDQISRLAKVLNPEGSFAGRLLESRKLIDDGEGTLSSFLMQKEAAQGAPLSDAQVKIESEKFQELKKAKEDLERQLKEEKEKHAKDIAELGFNQARAKAKRESKKSGTEYKEERKAIISSIKDKWKNAGRDSKLSSDIPFRKQFAAIAPDVKKLAESFIKEGIDKFDNLVTQLHAELKDAIDSFTKQDVIDILAGEHDAPPKTATKNELAAQVRLLQREAKLVKELAAARKGEEAAKTETKKVEKTRRIKELEEKIKEVRRLNKSSEEGEPVDDISVTIEERTNKEVDRLLKKAAKLSKEIKEGKFAKPIKEPKPFAKSKKLQAAQDKVMDLENKIRHERSKDEYNKRSKWRRAFDRLMEALGLRRLIQTALDMSIPFRQGVTLFSPRQIDVWAKGFMANLKSVFSPKRFERIMYSIRNNKLYHDMINDGVVFNDLGSADPNLHNEDFRKSFFYKIPLLSEPVKASNRSADAFLNVARMELYTKMRNVLEQKGLTREADPAAFKFIGNWVMSMTGRGHMLNALENKKAQFLLGNTFFGARLMASRFNLLNPVTYFDPRVPRQARVEAMKDMAAFTVTIMAVGLALAAAGGDISLDPDDSDFLQIRFGDKVYDISGGLVAYVRTFLRITKAGYTKASSTKYEGREATENAGMSVVNFFRNKLSPNTAYATDLFFGKAYGQDFDAWEIAKIYPMYADDALKALKDDGAVSLATVLLPNILGVGYGSYASRGQIDATLEDLKERNMRSDEMNKESIKNYNDGGRPITEKEFYQFAKERDAEIERGLDKLFNDGYLVIDENFQVVQKPYKELTKDQVVKATNEIKASATRKVKEKLFGEQVKSDELIEAEKELQEIKQEREEDQNQ